MTFCPDIMSVVTIVFAEEFLFALNESVSGDWKAEVIKYCKVLSTEKDRRYI